MHYPKEDDGEHYTACLLIKGLRDIEPRILYPKEESGSHCLLILDLKPHSAGLKNGSTIYPTNCTMIAVEIPTCDGIYNLFDCFDCKMEIESEKRLEIEAKVISSKINYARKANIPLSNLTTI